jgi:ppGpp synthetase/RelA/SpoT-type nucleotidyltranferase
MATEWAKREYDKAAVDAAGAILADPKVTSDALDTALVVVNNWRLSHAFPLNTFQSTLRRKATQVDPESLTAQRLKRLRAIRHKLQKHTRNPITLSEMQDIGGCRAVLRTVAQVRELQERYLKGDLKHKLYSPIDDYIAEPRFSGYRGVHLIYGYFSDKTEYWNGSKIEVQLRTQMQHAWATAVEIVGFFRQELLKSSEGNHAWKQFFKLMATEIALREKSPIIPGLPSSKKDLRDELQRCVRHVNALTHLHAFGQGIVDVQEMDIQSAHWFLLELDTLNRRLKITGYTFDAKARASLDYAAVERSLLGSGQHDAVLVSVQSMADLKRAYTNYFLDLRKFTQIVEEAVSGASKGSASQTKTVPIQGVLPFANGIEKKK